MKSERYHNSFLKQDWFPTNEELPANAIEQICQRSRQLQQAMASSIEHTHVVTWHDHNLTTGVPFHGCQACSIQYTCWYMLNHMCAHVSGVVMDFYDEPDHHRELEIAVQLYAWSLFLINLCTDRLYEYYSDDLEEYARYRLEELYGESLVHKDLEEAEYERLEPRPEKTSDFEQRFLVTAFTTVYSNLLKDLGQWKNLRQGLPVAAFPALEIETLLRPSVDTPHWVKTMLDSAMTEKATLITLPLFEWHLLAMVLTESFVHFTYCQSPYGTPVSPPLWIPRHQQHWKDRSIVQSLALWKGLITVLDGLDKHFLVHICDDFNFAHSVPDQEMRQTLMHRFYTFHGSPDDYDAEKRYQVVSSANLAWYLARRIDRQIVSA